MTRNATHRLSRRDLAEAGLLLALGLAVIGGLAAIAIEAGEPPRRLGGLTLSPLPEPTATARAQSGWWDEVTPGPLPLGGVPGIPTVSLSAAAGGKAGEPVPFAVVSCPLPNVRVEAITAADRRAWWNITGTAALPELWYWKGEISPDGEHWSMLYRSETAVTCGLLIEFNTRTVPAGPYLVRLTAVDRTGNYPETCTVQVTVAR